MSNTQKLNETASGGAVGAGGIAVRTDGPKISGKERKRLQQYLQSFQKKVVNRWKYAPVAPFPIRVSEAFDLQDVLSRLRGIEGKASTEGRDNVTYGVEDDEGNIMKVTVRKSQAAEFETTLAQELADIEAFSVTGTEGKDVSMAELLYNLKDKFDIVDVEFPKIPTDVVYNADKATYKATDDMPANDQVDDSQAGGLNQPPMDGDMGDMGGGDMGGMEGEDDGFGPISSKNAKMDLNDVEGEDDLLGGEGGDMGAGGDMEGGEMDMEGDAEGVEDFAEPPADEGSILDRVLDMLKAQAEAEVAKANAEAEKYRADQAEYSARAANATIAQEEELARMEAKMEKQKEQEKQAKKLADIAKYRVSSASRVTEGDEGETVAMIRKLMSNLPMKWEIFPDDDAETRTYKNTQKANETRELQARMRTARTREIRQAQLRERGKGGEEQQQPNQQQQQGRPGQQQQAPNQQQAPGNANQ